jgi:RNA polymerase sigma factor (sigma-70 family)
MQEEDLVLGLKNRQQDTLRYLYDNYGPALHGVIFHIVRSQEMAEDLLQETFVKIWHNIQSYDKNKGRLYTWMLNIARNLAIDKTRSAEYKQAEKTDNTLNAVYTRRLPSDEEIIPEHIDLKEIVSRLRKEQRELIDLIYFYGHTQAEAAEKLKIPLGTVKTRVRQAIGELRKLFAN